MSHGNKNIQAAPAALHSQVEKDSALKVQKHVDIEGREETQAENHDDFWLAAMRRRAATSIPVVSV